MPDELRRIGNQMANVMYQLAQRPGDALTPQVAAVMDDLRKQWDAAIGGAQSAARVTIADSFELNRAACALEAIGNYPLAQTVRRLADRISMPGIFEDER